MLFGIRLMILLAIMGGAIAYIADKLGSKIGKKRLTVFSLRPHDTSVLLTVLSGVLISLCSVLILAVSSNSARTALFGMEKLQNEIRTLQADRETALKEYESLQDTLRSKNEEIAALDKKIRDADAARLKSEESLQAARTGLEAARIQYETTQGELVAAQSEVKGLQAARDSLNEEITKLQERTKLLHEGLLHMREDQLVYRSGEVVFNGVLEGGRSPEESANQMKWLLESANNTALSRIGVDPKEKVEVVWVPKTEYEALEQRIQKEHGQILVRVRSLANTVVGQPVVCQFEVIPNKLVYHNNQLIYQKVLNVADQSVSPEEVMMSYLQEVNRLSVEAGVLPDPMTGKVGNISAMTVVDVQEKMRRMGGQVMLTAYADGDIMTAGPVQIRLEAEKVASADESMRRW
ncbi:MAG: DUF3084 domain-containing protein [Acidaminococcaceae bacterium]|nr:DUF3084 domain-containing protein [Acidaminococcaceae bacterium]